MKWYIGNIEIKNQVCLAPMAGISNSAYFRIVEDMGCGYAITELISSEAIVRNNKKTLDMLRGIEKVKMPVGVQLFGSNPDALACAARIITKMYPKVFIDINMGCPVPKVALRSEAGSALLKNPQKIGEIVSKVVAAVNVPVTVKIRSGWDAEHINATLIAKICEENGASAIAIHARTRSQGYTGKANWDIIKEVKECVKIPVIGNGDITSPELAQKMLLEAKCDAVMIGRWALGNPWAFRECITYLTTGELIPKPTNLEKITMIKYHYNLLKEDKNVKLALLEIRTHALNYLKGMASAKEYKERICKCKTEEEFLNILNEFETKIKRGCPKTK